jgi:hypothetical protein
MSACQCPIGRSGSIQFIPGPAGLVAPRRPAKARGMSEAASLLECAEASEVSAAAAREVLKE